MKRLIIVLCVMLFGHVTSGHMRDNDHECDHPPPNNVFDNFGQCLTYILNNSFPFEKLNASCVAEACPQLTTACPYNCDGSLNPQALTKLGSILTSCIQLKEVICEVNLGQLPIVPLTFTTATLLDPSMANGSCALNPGTAFVQYLNNTVFSFPPALNSGKGPFTLQMNVPFFNYQSSCTCDFNLTSLQDVPFLRPLTHMTFPAMLAQANYTLKPTVAIDPKTYAITALTMETQQSIGASNFTALGLSLPPCMVNSFNQAATGFFDEAPVITQAVNFLSTFIVSGLRAANQSCAKP